MVPVSRHELGRSSVDARSLKDRRDSVSAGLFASGAHPTRSAEPIGVHLLTLSPFRIERSSTTSMKGWHGTALDGVCADYRLAAYRQQDLAFQTTQGGEFGNDTDFNADNLITSLAKELDRQSVWRSKRWRSVQARADHVPAVATAGGLGR
jgi:hypothetical protein